MYIYNVHSAHPEQLAGCRLYAYNVHVTVELDISWRERLPPHIGIARGRGRVCAPESTSISCLNKFFRVKKSALLCFVAPPSPTPIKISGSANGTSHPSSDYCKGRIQISLSVFIRSNMNLGTYMILIGLKPPPPR